MVCAAVIVVTQAPAPLHAPPQPENVEPLAGVAVNVTSVPGAKVVLHVVGQLIPAGVLVTIPLPVSVTDNAIPALTSNTTPAVIPPFNVVPYRFPAASMMGATE